MSKGIQDGPDGMDRIVEFGIGDILRIALGGVMLLGVALMFVPDPAISVFGMMLLGVLGAGAFFGLIVVSLL